MQQAFPSHVPEKIIRLLGTDRGRLFVGNTSGASVYRIETGGEVRYLKVMHPTPATSLGIEAGLLEWLRGKLPVPEILAFETVHNGPSVCDYMVTAAVEGKPATDVLDLEPLRAARLLAEGLRMIHAISPDRCPADYRLENRLKTARERIVAGRIDAGDLTRKKETPAKRLARLEKGRHDEELVFTHGDYCLPNVLLGVSGVSGFVDFAFSGLGDRHRDLALAVRSIEYNLGRRGANWRAIGKAVNTFYRWYGEGLVNRALIPYYQDLDELA